MPESQAHITILVHFIIMTLINSMACLDIVCPKKTCKSRGM